MADDGDADDHLRRWLAGIILMDCEKKELGQCEFFGRDTTKKVGSSKLGEEKTNGNSFLRKWLSYP